jgi:hypothetical protein
MTVLYTEEQTVSDWAKVFGGHSEQFYFTDIEVNSGVSLASGTMLGKLTANGKYTTYNNSASDGSQTFAGILVSPISANAVAASGYLGTSGTTKITFAANTVGEQGNEITVTFVDPGTTASTASVSTSGSDIEGYTITVSLETSGGAIASVSTGIVTLINNDATASGLITATNVGDGSTALAAGTVTLSGGAEYAIDNQAKMLENLEGWIIYFDKLTYSGGEAAAKAAIVSAGGKLAKETD